MHIHYHIHICTFRHISYTVYDICTYIIIYIHAHSDTYHIPYMIYTHTSSYTYMHIHYHIQTCIHISYHIQTCTFRLISYTCMHIHYHIHTCTYTCAIMKLLTTKDIRTYSDFHNDCLFFSTRKNYIDTER